MYCMRLALHVVFCLLFLCCVYAMLGLAWFGGSLFLCVRLLLVCID